MNERSVDEVVRLWAVAIVFTIGLLIGAHLLAQRAPGTWYGDAAEAVPGIVLVALMFPALLNVLAPLAHLLVSLALLVGAWRTETASPSNRVAGPFVEHAGTRRRRGLRAAFRHSYAVRLLVTAIVVIGVQAAIAAAR